jgi:ADP-ribosylglycohydrolase
MDDKQRIRGSILALACGDALGAPVEFLSQTELVNRYGEGGITELEESYGTMGAYTDDTQMSIATARGILRARGRERELGGRGSVDPTGFIYEQYINWLLLQSEPGQSRGPGNTCLSALRSGVAGHSTDPINDSKGCGGIMRVAPVGLVYEEKRAWLYGNESAALTHGHPGGWLPAGFQAVLISHMLAIFRRDGDRAHGAVLMEAFNVAMDFLEKVPTLSPEAQQKREHFAGLMVNARSLAMQTKWSDEMVMRKLGAGWCGDEACAMAFFIAVRHPDNLREAVEKAVLYSGDRDSVGCIAGALMGVLCGETGIPASWLGKVEDFEGLSRLAEELFEVAL